MPTETQEKLRRIANVVGDEKREFIFKFEPILLAASVKLLEEKLKEEKSTARLVIVSRGTLPGDKFDNWFDPVSSHSAFNEGHTGVIYGMLTFMVHSFEGWPIRDPSAVMAVFPVADGTIKEFEQQRAEFNKLALEKLS